MYLAGVDVSHVQGIVDWAAAAAAPEPLSFGIAKATQGIYDHDPLFSRNYAEIKASGLNFVLAFLEKTTGSESLQSGDLPVVVDVEMAQKTLNGAKYEADLLIFRNILAERTGRGKIIVYTSQYFWNTFVNASTQFGDDILWVAEYTNAPQPKLPAGWTSWTFWQWSGSGDAPGVATQVDLDRFDGDQDALNALAGITAVEPVATSVPE
jgi:lysozyme